MTDVGREISAAMSRIAEDEQQAAADERFHLALAAVKLDPPATDPAWDEYEAAAEALAALREERA